ncbi:hypothetical protein MKX03_011150, partial [Papaver bracteatum]
ALVRHTTDAMKESRVAEILNSIGPPSYKKLYLEESYAAAISTYQLEALKGWEQIATRKLWSLFKRTNKEPMGIGAGKIDKKIVWVLVGFKYIKGEAKISLGGEAEGYQVAWPKKFAIQGRKAKNFMKRYRYIAFLLYTIYLMINLD